ncbi:Gti1/Pac2 family-domain-containing protein [Mycena metata]|uniref:Gti1/Pac2 family-domain-containing protein n=1 Tax=Mycena metata TaxID=1033252 RepID=A0AAD7HSR0_9AGAR|nr:Gti1/Pac2 family-domain-containing protein [Mycena metata]
MTVTMRLTFPPLMSFRVGVNQPQPGPYVTHPSLHLRDVTDAHRVLEAVRRHTLPLIRRRLVSHERAQLKSGNVFVWEEAEDSDEGGLVRWTEGRRWSQSRMRGDYLFYEEKIETTQEEKQAKAARRANKASDLAASLPAPPRRKDRPSKVDGLTKQTYSVTVRMPGSPTTRKWHIVAYFSASDYTRLPVIENYDYLRDIRVPDGIFTSNRTAGGNADLFPSYSDEFDSTRGSHSPVSPSFELRDPMLPPFYRRSASAEPSLRLPPPISVPRETNPRVRLPPLSSIGYHSPRPPLPSHHSTTSSPNAASRARRSPEDRRILDSFRVVL